MASVEEEYDIIDDGEIHRIMQEGNQEDDATSQIIVKQKLIVSKRGKRNLCEGE